MSIHAQLSEEAQARLAAQRRNSTVLSGVIAFLVIAIICLLLGLFLLPSLIKETPTIVTYQANEAVVDAPEPQKAKSSIQRKPTSPASSMARVIASTTPSTVSIPVPEVAVSQESVEFGDSEDFGGGWGDATDFGQGGGGASFFNQSVSAQRIAYVIDYSASMKGAKDKLMRVELTKSIGGLKPGTQYQMIFFSGPAWVAGSEVSVNGGTGLVKGTDGKKHEWSGKGALNWTPAGKLPQPEWLDVTARQLKESLEIIEKTKLYFGTDWSHPLKMAFEMEPPPQIIFFMTDGTTGGNMMELTDDLASKARNKGIMINAVAMMEPQAEEPMFQLADKTGGVFTIVDADGNAREVKSVGKQKKQKGKKKRK